MAGRRGAFEAEESRCTGEESEVCQEQPGGHCASRERDVGFIPGMTGTLEVSAWERSDLTSDSEGHSGGGGSTLWG